jgi:DNA-binding NtrC family response regulator
MPALRDRRSDVAVLAEHFLRRYAKENHADISGFERESVDVLMNYDWPGNVRELENAIERAVVMCNGPRIEPHHLPAAVGPVPTHRSVPTIPGSSLEEIERYAILTTLEATGGSTSRAAELLGISVRKIQYKLHEYKAAPKSDIDAVATSASAKTN